MVAWSIQGTTKLKEVNLINIWTNLNASDAQNENMIAFLVDFLTSEIEPQPSQVIEMLLRHIEDWNAICHGIEWRNTQRSL